MGGQEDITKLSWIFSSSRLAQNIFQVLGAGHLDKLTGRETTIIMLFFRIRVLLTAISVFVLVQLTVAYPLPWVPDVSSSLNLDRANDNDDNSLIEDNALVDRTEVAKNAPLKHDYVRLYQRKF